MRYRIKNRRQPGRPVGSTHMLAPPRTVSSVRAAPAPDPNSDLTEVDDAALARALIERHPHAPRTAWARFSPLVRRIVRRSLGPASDTEDAVQDVFVCLFEKAHTLRDPAALKAFIVAITVRTVRYQVRRRRVRAWVGLGDTGELPDIRVVESNTESRQALLHFYRILDRVGSKDRAAFVLRFIDGMEVADVAAALETSVPTARRRFTRAYRRVALLAGRDPFLAEYLASLKVGEKT